MAPLWGFGSEDGPSTDAPASAGLYDQYASGKASGDGTLKAGETKSSYLRRERVRLNVYLNQEGVGVTVIGGPQGHGTILMLPLEVDTLEEVLPLIQLKLDLDARLLYVAELWLPDGTPITAFQELVDAAAIDTPIIVGCGEPFDGSRVPLDLLEFHKQGGGRQAVHKVNRTIAQSRKTDKLAKAESVRQSGHGLLPNSLAVVTARTQTVETNREKAANLRQYYLESLVRRTADQEDYKFAAKQNIQFHRMEKEESKMRIEEKQRDRMDRLNNERQRDSMDVNKSKREDTHKAQMLHDKIKAGSERSKAKKKAHSERYRTEARKADFGTRPGQDKKAITDKY